MTFKLFIFIGLFYSSFARAEEMDISFIYRCDDVYCNGQAPARFEDRLRRQVGVVVPPANIQAPSIPRTRLISAAIQANPAVTGGTGGGQNPSSNIPQAISDTGAPNSETGGIQKSSVGGQGPAANGGGYNSQPLPGVTGNPNVRGGLLYADDEKEENKISAGQGLNASSPTLQNIPGAKIDPVAQNRQNGGESAPLASGLAASALNLLEGGSESGSGGSGGSTAEPESLLSKLVKAVGADHFFSSPGGAFGSLLGQKNSASTLSGGAAQSKLPPSQGLRDPKDILRENYEKYRRGLASQLEFGSSQSFLFQNMCQHYINYAQKNRIPKNDSPCPLN